MAITYNKTSPYANTNTFAFFLDVADIPAIPYDPNDVQYQIDVIYKGRPDLLAFDLDPIFDFLPGAIIFIPKKDTITSVLGI